MKSYVNVVAAPLGRQVEVRAIDGFSGYVEIVVRGPFAVEQAVIQADEAISLAAALVEASEVARS